MIRLVAYTALGAFAYAMYSGDITASDLGWAFDAATQMVATNIAPAIDGGLAWLSSQLG